MKLMTKQLAREFEKVGEQINNDNPIVVAKFFTPWTYWTWYATEYYPDSGVCYGFVEGQESERGYFSLDELKSLQGPRGLKIERDLRFQQVFFNELNLRGGR